MKLFSFLVVNYLVEVTTEVVVTSGQQTLVVTTLLVLTFVVSTLTNVVSTVGTATSVTAGLHDTVNATKAKIKNVFFMTINI
jgi:fructose-1-phosphate kinase PfkB-like protein